MTADYSLVSREKQDEAVEEVMWTGVIACAIAMFIPIPFWKVFILSPLQYAMVRSIGNIRGHKLTKESAKEVIGTIGAGIVFQQLCLVIADVAVPILGGMIFGTTYVVGATWMLGKAADYYFTMGKAPSKQQLADWQREGKQKAKSARQEAKQAKSEESFVIDSQDGVLHYAHCRNVVEEYLHDAEHRFRTFNNLLDAVGYLADHSMQTKRCAICISKTEA